MEDTPEGGQELLCVGLNQDNGCFAVGCHTGFRVFNCEPFTEQFRRVFSNPEGGIKIVEMLFRCNILALVGGGPTPRYPSNKVMIWDDHQGRCIGELTFRSQVQAVKLRRDRIAVCLDQKVLVYNFADLRLVHQWETLHNPYGLMCMSSLVDATVLACPGLHVGQVRVELCDRRQTRFISAHQNALSCIALSLNGTRIATASDRGTLIRVFDTWTCEKLQEVRRGSEIAHVYSLAFDKCSEWLAVSSDRNTVHVFMMCEAVRNTEGIEGVTSTPSVESPTAARTNPGSWLTMAKGIVPLPTYFSSEWSFAQFKIPETGVAVVGFGPQPHTLVVITKSGSFYRLQFDPVNGGPMEQLAYNCFDNPDEAGPLGPEQ